MADPLALEIERLLADAPEAFSPLGAGILAASWLGIARDSRSFARKLELAHALVLRECVALAEEAGLIILDDRQDKSHRLFYHLSPAGLNLFDAKGASS
ncbi:MAG: hypothetical protein CSA70_09625 [Rhodobacterales bacterium]|nr:MAG: hypothetical protein CSA70_09625 [Rhodobacterales bacterium]